MSWRDEAEAVDVELELAEVRAAVVHHDLVRIGRAAVLHVRGAGAAGVVEDLGAVVDDVVDGRLDGQRRGVELRRERTWMPPIVFQRI